MTWIQPKTDWTSSDCYNFIDLNRVEINTQHLRDYLLEIGFPAPSMTFITNRNAIGFETISSVNRVEANIEKLRLSFITPSDWQSAVSWTYTRGFTYQDANRWEQSVSNLYGAAQSTFQGYRYAGTFTSGQEVLLP